MHECPVCQHFFKTVHDLARHIVLKAEIDEEHRWFKENLQITWDRSDYELVEAELHKLGLKDNSYIRFGFIREPENKNINSSPSTTGVPQYLWDKAKLSTQLRDQMSWPQWVEFTSRHGEVFLLKPSKHKCIRCWAQGKMKWHALRLHLEVMLNYHLKT